MGWVRCFLAASTTNVGMYRSTLDRAWTDDRDLDDQIAEAPGFDARQGGHLGTALDLEDTHRVGFAQHVVDGVFLGHESKVDVHPVCLADEINASVESLEHAESEKVELHEAHSSAVLLVPLKS